MTSIGLHKTSSFSLNAQLGEWAVKRYGGRLNVKDVGVYYLALVIGTTLTSS